MEDSVSDHPGSSDAEFRFSVPQMNCDSCAENVSLCLKRTEGVLQWETRPMTGTVDLTLDSDRTTPGQVRERLREAGYPVEEVQGEVDGLTPSETPSVWIQKRAIKTWICGLFLAVGLLLKFAVPGGNLELWNVPGILPIEIHLPDPFLLLSIVAGGQIILSEGWRSLWNRSPGINFLMSIAILGAVAVGLFVEAATLAFLYNLAELLEDFSVRRARRSIQNLLEMAPEEARLIQGENTKMVPVTELEEGDLIAVQPGEQIPMDGEVIEGESAVNQAPITGESIPVDKQHGDEVYAGTLNNQGYLEVRITGSASENTLSRIIELVEEARQKKTRREKFVESFASIYTPIVVLLGLATFLLMPVLFEVAWTVSLVYGITLLVIACPCAFVISTPVSVVSAVTAAARNGVLIKGGRYLETMGEIESLALDKTGTLTEGTLKITDIVPLNGRTEEDVLRCARGIEQRSEHPIAEAIVSHAEQRGVPRRDVSHFRSMTGKGVRAKLDGEVHFAGKPAFFQELGFDLDHVHHSSSRESILEEAAALCDREDCLNVLETTIPRLRSEGKTVILVSTEERVEGLIAVADVLREHARDMVEQLKSLGLKEIIMISGDSPETAEAIGREVGVDRTCGGLLPEEKVEKVEELQEEYGTVAMVGDGINDAPALAVADVGVAMGAKGTDTAIESADIALMGEDLMKLPYLYRLSTRANRVIQQNIWSSLVVKFVLGIGVPLGWVGLATAILVGDAGMTAAITGNATRLSSTTPS